MNPAVRISTVDELPPLPGSYALALRLQRTRTLTVGRLGRFEFRAGTWLYVGSARGPGGLRARVGRHWLGPARSRWHIDYLRRAAAPLGAAVRQADASLECRWAARLADAPHWTSGPEGFGASDCRCPTHLFEWTTTGGPTVADGLAGVLSYDLWLEATG
jgi:Uri superfamily endonuclease